MKISVRWTNINRSTQLCSCYHLFVSVGMARKSETMTTRADGSGAQRQALEKETRQINVPMGSPPQVRTSVELLWSWRLHNAVISTYDVLPAGVLAIHRYTIPAERRMTDQLNAQRTSSSDVTLVIIIPVTDYHLPDPTPATIWSSRLLGTHRTAPVLACFPSSYPKLV